MNTDNHYLKNIRAKVFIILALLVGLAVNVSIINIATIFNTKAAPGVVDVLISPSTANIPPDATFTISINPRGQTIKMAEVVLYIDPAVIRLASEISIPNSPLNEKIFVTTMNEANLNGEIRIVLQDKVIGSIPSQSYNIAQFSLTGATRAVEATAVEIIDEPTEIYDDTGTPLEVNVNSAEINAGRASGPSPGVIDPENPTPSPASGNCGEDFIDTAIGCIPYGNTQLMTEFFLRWGMGIAGGIALILLAYSGYMVTTSLGDPKRLQAGKELATSAFSGLVLLVFSAYILKVIGVDILQIPGL